MKVFLLGGADLEMQEIKKLLDEKQETYYDKNLSWGAKLSDYEDVLNDTDEFIAIELEEDITPPKHYTKIDHHNDLPAYPTSLEQIAKLLDIELSREQQLIAYNDAEHIKGMSKLCATKQEIDDIRKRDRDAQGVTQDDEILAIKSVYDLKTNIIYSHTLYFSAVADRVWDKFDNYVIYNDTKAVFYNYEVKKVIAFLEQNGIEKTDFYSGGGKRGFVGLKDNVLDKQQIEKLLESFKTYIEEKPIISYHTFMLPFTFDGEFDKKDDWDYKKFEIKTQRDYNEYIYFYKHVQDAIFNKEDDEKKEDFISKYYEYKEQEGEFVIQTKNREFTLQLDGISLRIFNTKVAILAFNLINYDYKNPDDILSINEFGRRIYPQFLGNDFTIDTKKAFLACKVTLKLKDQESISDDFGRFDDIKKLDSIKDDLLPRYINHLIKQNFNLKNKEKILRPIIDDRMFVISMYLNDELTKKLSSQNIKKEICCNKLHKTFDSYRYENDDFWYKYIFVDEGDKTCQSKHMTKELIQEATYDRWVEWGTLFGITRYSFVALTGSWYGKVILLPHIQTMYFQIFTLLLAYRASIIKFSDDIQNATDEDKELYKKAKNIYHNYLRFLNKLYFKEVTAQDQGIELYNKAMAIMDIDKFMKDLDNEINELHTFTDMIEEKKYNDEQKKINKKLNDISIYGGILLFASFFTGFFGMNVGSNDNFSWFFVLIVIVLSIVIPYNKFKKD